MSVGCDGTPDPIPDAGVQPPNNNNNNNNNQDAGTKPDAGEPDAGTTRECSSEIEYPGTLANESFESDENGVFYFGDLNDDPDSLDIRLFDGYGVFANGVAPGTYQLAGEELNWATCGLCILLVTESGDAYLPTGGTVTLTTAGPGGVVGTLSNVTFAQVNIDETTFESTPHESGCTTGLSTATLNAPAAPITCAAEAAYTGTLANAEAAEDGAGSYQYTGELNGDSDELIVLLLEGRGVFAGGVAPGTYPLTGAELSYATCGLCVFVESENGQLYMATGGEVTITSVRPNVAGSLSNVTFAHVNIAQDGTTTPHISACESGIATATFDAALPAVVCTAEAAYAGTLTSELATEDGVGNYEYSASLNAEPDELKISLVAGKGVFAAGVTPGIYTLAGDELSLATCGLCVRVKSENGEWYMATGGTVEISTVRPNITGTLTDVTFARVNIAADGTTTPHTSGCTSGIATATFSGALPACAAEAAYTGTLTNEKAVANGAGGSDYTGELNGEPDTLQVSLRTGKGVFAAGVATGTFQLTGDELNLATCGLCVRVQSENGQWYMATGGQVTLTSVTPNVTGTLTNVTFARVNVATDGSSTPHASACTSGIATATFDGAPPPVVCSTEAAYTGTLTNEEAGQTAGGDYLYQGDLNGEPDELMIQLYDGYGVFTGGITTGTFALTGDELNFSTCGLCVRIRSENGEWYMATGGSVTVSSVSPNITGTLSNVTFQHVTITNNVSTPHASGCTSGIATASFNGAPPPVVCSADAAYTGTLTNQAAEAFTGGVDFGADLNGDPDEFRLELYDGSGVFAGGIATGTFPIAGDELNYRTCGLCVRVRAEDGAWYMATGGSVTLSSVTGTLAGSVSNLTFEQVNIAGDFTSTPHPSACTSGLVNASFSSTIL